MGYIGWTWLGIIAICIIIETATLGLTTIWFAIGAFIGMVFYLLGFSLHVQIIMFLIVSIACLFVTRPIAVQKLRIGNTKTNADSLIGEFFKVETTIDNINNEGTVKARGQIWSARSYNGEIIEKDTIIQVKEIRGVKLIVEKKKN